MGGLFSTVKYDNVFGPAIADIGIDVDKNILTKKNFLTEVYKAICKKHDKNFKEKTKSYYKAVIDDLWTVNDKLQELLRSNPEDQELTGFAIKISGDIDATTKDENKAQNTANPNAPPNAPPKVPPKVPNLSLQSSNNSSGGNLYKLPTSNPNKNMAKRAEEKTANADGKKLNNLSTSINPSQKITIVNPNNNKPKMLPLARMNKNYTLISKKN